VVKRTAARAGTEGGGQWVFTAASCRWSAAEADQPTLNDAIGHRFDRICMRPSTLSQKAFHLPRPGQLIRAAAPCLAVRPGELVVGRRQATPTHPGGPVRDHGMM
jgi:hypothetical protein